MSDASRQHQDKAEQLVSRGRLDAALAEYQQAARALPGDLGLQERLAELHEKLGHRAEALAGYEAVVQGRARAGQPLRAMVACRALLKLEPTNTRAPRSSSTAPASPPRDHALQGRSRARTCVASWASSAKPRSCRGR